jgi:DNA (cytosine-5)-methyltransferase 1
MMRVADFFCGAGGFSEGFRQKGFQVVFALDNWRPAVCTHEFNHPGCNHALMDILKLNTPEMIDTIVPDTEIIIGSPPCVAFSGSNKAGKADKSHGIRLIEAYLRIIAWKKKKGVLKYWILENVPNSGKYIKEEYSWEELGLPGKGPKLTMQQRNILNAAEYGAPQGRLRFFCGDYPLPKKTHEAGQMVTVRHVFECLTNPLSKKHDKIEDPNYGFHVDASQLTDHFYDSRVAEFEWKRAKRLKKDHGFMGRMSFPEEEDRPSRTVMATMSASTRESMIFSSFDEKGKRNGYRLPTIREIACFMSYPITYQFQANSDAAKFRLVGNAVCSKISGALAEAIVKEERINIPPGFAHLPDARPSFDLTGTKRNVKVPGPRKPDSKFAIHIPYLKIRTFRVELSNTDSDFLRDKIVWKCILHQGTGKRAMKHMPVQDKVEKLLTELPNFKNFREDLLNAFKNQASSKELQLQYCLNDDTVGPIAALERMKRIIDTNFPEGDYSDKSMDNTKRSIKIDRDGIPVRILAGVYACNHFVNTLKND